MIATQTKAKERPILFSGPMVRAILDGRKTMTRRVVKGCAGTDVAYWPGMVHGGDFVRPEHCPYGKPGDRLWVRETFWYRDRDGMVCYSVDRHMTFHPTSILGGAGVNDVAPADPAAVAGIDMKECGWRLRPSIHMPRWASRILLEIVSVRVERLQEISEADAIAEGVLSKEDAASGVFRPQGYFQDLWDSINAARGHAWAANPWVWVVEFKVVTDAV